MDKATHKCIYECSTTIAASVIGLVFLAGFWLSPKITLAIALIWQYRRDNLHQFLVLAVISPLVIPVCLFALTMAIVFLSLDFAIETAKKLMGTQSSQESEP